MGGTLGILGALAGGYMDESDKKRKQDFETESERRKQTVGLIGELVGRPDISEETRGWLVGKGLEIIQAPAGKKIKFDIMEAPVRPAEKFKPPTQQMEIPGTAGPAVEGIPQPPAGAAPNINVPVPHRQVQEAPPPPGNIFMSPGQMGQRKLDSIRAQGVDVDALNPRDRAQIATGVNLPRGAMLQRVQILHKGKPVMAVFNPEIGEFSVNGQPVDDAQPLTTVDETVIQDPKSSTGWVKVYTDKNTQQERGRMEVPPPAGYLPTVSTGQTIVFDQNNQPVPVTTTRTTQRSMPKPQIQTPPAPEQSSSAPSGSGDARMGKPLPMKRFSENQTQQKKSLMAIRTGFDQLEKLMDDFTKTQWTDPVEKAKTAKLLDDKANSMAVAYGKALGEVGNFAQQEQEKYIKAFYPGIVLSTMSPDLAKRSLNNARQTLDTMEGNLGKNLFPSTGGQGMATPPAPPKDKPQGKPVYVNGQLVGHTLDGKTMIPVGK